MCLMCELKNRGHSPQKIGERADKIAVGELNPVIQQANARFKKSFAKQVVFLVPLVLFFLLASMGGLVSILIEDVIKTAVLATLSGIILFCIAFKIKKLYMEHCFVQRFKGQIAMSFAITEAMQDIGLEVVLKDNQDEEISGCSISGEQESRRFEC